ncbi:uncharacterized protein LOC111256312 [Setaria italica]|uniref:uncharacterized protein LOC111256312 n=1 Tax=Setaria italica TaxID=4555 RepID=UPI000BE4E58E|nr:uncharacterized protein LOC111256312 [Setaria italica]XP_034583648.1 uncharacterized protein LOC117846546 isoform X2 [Setaria viridis]XP_034583649.1 uncharacterized protein LOC117846546 isoform X2 [Setaria viridis]XP_034583650.1 uncharacterized protein LOC117846546 isoform X2 [Setaria viridis]
MALLSRRRRRWPPPRRSSTRCCSRLQSPCLSSTTTASPPNPPPPPLLHWKRKVPCSRSPIRAPTKPSSTVHSPLFFRPKTRTGSSRSSASARGSSSSKAARVRRTRSSRSRRVCATSSTGADGEHWVDEVLRRRFLRLVRWNEKRRRVDQPVLRNNLIVRMRCSTFACQLISWLNYQTASSLEEKFAPHLLHFLTKQ